MTPLLGLAARSAWNRRFVLSLVVLSIALATFLLLAVERIRADVRDSFAQSVSGADLIVGPRTGAVQLLLYSVFRIGNPTHNLRWSSAQQLARHPAVRWTVPLALGDSHRGFAVVATTHEYFEHFRYGDRRALEFAHGAPFAQLYDAVLGAEVARRLGYRLGQRITLAHGDGALPGNEHADKPFTVVGVLQPTGTPVDRSVHIGLQAMQALHADWLAGVPLPAARGLPSPAPDLTPRTITALLVGLHQRSAVFAVQRDVAQFADEPLMAILPGVALDELWTVVGAGERALLATSALVALVSFAGLIATVLAGLEQRRRELAILRAVGAGPRHLLWLLSAEGALVAGAGVALGAFVWAAALAAAGSWFERRFGIALQAAWPSQREWLLIGALLAAGWLASLAPGLRAYRLSLADGLSPRT